MLKVLQQLASESQAFAASRVVRLEGKQTTLQPSASSHLASQLASQSDCVAFSARASTVDSYTLPSPHAKG